MGKYSIVSHKGHDVKVINRKDGVYFETTLYQMGESVNVGQFYKIEQDLTGNEYANKIDELLDDFIKYYEGCK